jgi:hypothetical protein
MAAAAMGDGGSSMEGADSGGGGSSVTAADSGGSGSSIRVVGVCGSSKACIAEPKPVPACKPLYKDGVVILVPD